MKSGKGDKAAAWLEVLGGKRNYFLLRARRSSSFFFEELPFCPGGESSISSRGADFGLPTAREGGYIGGMNVKMEGRWGQAIFGGTVIMLAALASGCGELSARRSISPATMLLSGFGSVVVGPPGFSLVGDRCGCDRSIFRVENGVWGLGYRSTS